MGLDITAYSNIRVAEGVEPDEDGDIPDDCFWVFTNGEEFPEHAGELKDGTIYRYDRAFGFCPGSYRRYNLWRDSLAVMAGYGSAKIVWEQSLSGPFSELISFSDCDGIIGHKFAAKLARDFAELDKKARGFSSTEFYAKYQDWRRAFELAANLGAVKFR
jgi:hypothetical protein